MIRDLVANAGGEERAKEFQFSCVHVFTKESGGGNEVSTQCVHFFSLFIRRFLHSDANCSKKVVQLCPNCLATNLASWSPLIFALLSYIRLERKQFVRCFRSSRIDKRSANIRGDHGRRSVAE